MKVARSSGTQAGLIVAGVLLCVPGAGAQQVDPRPLLTRAEATDFVETTRYDEVVAFVKAAAERSPLIRDTTFGYTFEGRALPLAVVGSVHDASPRAVRSSDKTVVYLQGNIHGGEVPGKEALLILLRDVVRGEHAALLDSLVLLVAPIFNADGNERVALTNRPRQHGPLGGMGRRSNAQGLDLNRDHTKLDSPEARSFAALMTEYGPHLTVDLHTTNGTRHGYHLTYSPPLHPATDAALVDFLRGELLPVVTRRIREVDGWDFYYYGNAYPLRQGADPAWITFDHRPRFNNNYVGLRNRLAILSEAYAYATFRDRVRASLRFVEEILRYAAGHAGEIRKLVAAADARPPLGDSLAVRATFQRSEEPVTILMGDVEEERNPYSGKIMLRRRDVQRPVEMYEFGTFRPTERARVPGAYHLPPGGEEIQEVVERLRAHGIRLRRSREEREVLAEVFHVDSVGVAEETFQGRRERTVWGVYRTERRVLPPGTVTVPLDQPLARLAFYLLEPRSDDGFLSWGFFDVSVEPGRPYPVLRAPEVRGTGGSSPGGGR